MREFACEGFYSFAYGSDDVATEGIKSLGKSIWITIKNVFKRIITWFKNILLNVNYFKNAELDEKMNKDLLTVLKLAQPRTEDNYKVLVKYYNTFKKMGGDLNRKFNGNVTGVAVSGNPIAVSMFGMTNLTDEINKSISDLDDSMNAARNSEEYKRIEESKYDNKNLKIIPLSNIIPDMKNSQSACVQYNGHVEKLEHLVSGVDNPDSVTKRIIVLLNKVVSYYTFRINLLTKYFTKAKASLKGTLNNIKGKDDEDAKSRTTTKAGKLALKLTLTPDKSKEVKEEYEACKNSESYSEYKPHYDKLTSLLNLQGANIEGITFSGNVALVQAVKHKEEKIPVKGRTLYHTSTGNRDLTELTPSFKTASGVLFPEPRVYVHIGVPLNRYGNKAVDEGSGLFTREEISYVVVDNITEVYRDPEMGRTASYIKTTKPIKVKKLDINKFNSDRDQNIDLSFSKKG